MGKIKEKIYELAEMVQDLIDSGIRDHEIDMYMESQLESESGMYQFYHAHKDIIFDMLGYMKESLNEGADWILLRSGNVVVDSWDGFFMKLDEKGHPDLTQEVTADDPEYEEIYNSLDDKDRQTVDEINNQGYMDESIVMPRLEERCNCDKKKLIPNIVRRPIPSTKKTIRPLLLPKKKLHEGFIEKSDPIKDMGIGTNPKREAKKFMQRTYGNINTIAEIYFNDRKMEGPAYVLHKFFRSILEGRIPQDAFYLAAEDENFYGNKSWIMEIREKVTNALQKYHGIKVNPNDPRLMDLDESYLMHRLFEDDMEASISSALRKAEYMKTLRAIVNKLTSIINSMERKVNMKYLEIGLGRDDNGYCILEDTITKTEYVFLISPEGDITYRGVYNELPKRNDLLGNINDEKSLKDGLYRYMRFGVDAQYESRGKRLKGKQSKLDMNKDKKLTAIDFKMLRDKKKK
jgi:hypothetical protein